MRYKQKIVKGCINTISKCVQNVYNTQKRFKKSKHLTFDWWKLTFNVKYCSLFSESYESDEYFRCCFESLGEIDGEIDGKNHEGKNTDGSDYADEYYIILDRVYEDFTHPAVSESHYTSLKNVCKSDLQAYREFCCLTTSSMLQYIQCL